MAILEQHKSVLLPLDIIEIILLRLSVKSLLRFKVVSKSWNTTISDPIFVRNHQHGSNKSHSMFLRKPVSSSNNSDQEFSLVKFEDKKFGNVRVLNGPVGFSNVLCSYDGVQLLTDDLYTTLGFWNPSTRTETFFPFPYRFYGYPVLSCGVCHYPTVGDDFKVVVISLHYYLMFSCKNESWTGKKAFGDYREGAFMCGSGVCVDGIVYWFKKHKGCQEIIYFDPIDDELKILQKPKNLEAIKRFYLIDVRGCLCLYGSGGDETKVEMWIKEKGRDNNSWKELITIENVQTPIWFFQPLFFAENTIVIRLNKSRLVVYNTGEKTFEEVEDDNSFNAHVVVPYLDSLFFPAVRNPIRKKKGSNAI